MNFNLIGYSIYLLVTGYVTVIVGYGFYKNGIHLIVDLFRGNTEAAGAMNTILLIGYYLVNIGYLALSIQTWPVIDNATILIDMLYRKVGVILLVLGVLHVNNIVCLHILAKRKDVIKFLTH